MGATLGQLSIGLAMVVAAGLLGVVSAGVSTQSRRAVLSRADTGRNLAWRLAMVLLLGLGLAVDGRAVIHSAWSMWTRSWQPTLDTAAAVPLIAGLYGLAAVWSRLPLLGRSNVAQADTYGQALRRLSGADLGLALGLRYPVTVVVEESFFRGWLQHQMAFGVIAASLLFAGYHLIQWRTIPSLVPYCLVGGVIVAWTGSLWVVAVLHCAQDAVFACLLNRRIEGPAVHEVRG